MKDGTNSNFFYVKTIVLSCSNQLSINGTVLGKTELSLVCQPTFDEAMLNEFQKELLKDWR